MKINFINNSYRRFYQAHKKEIDTAIQGCLTNGDLTLRKDVMTFEKRLAKFIGTKYAIGVGSGTDALFLSLKALGIGQGDEVITVSHTFIASIQVIVHCGATPVFADVDANELINVKQIEGLLTSRTKAIMPIHLTGSSCEMDAIMRVARKYKLYVIEDAAQALGAKYNGKKVGSFSNTGCFSFNTAKMMGAYGDAGAITTNDRKLYERLMLLRNHWNMAQLSVNKKDFPPPKTFEWAFKSRLDNIQAAVLNVKMKYLSQMIKRRNKIAIRYIDELWHLPDFPVRYNKYELPKEQEGRVWQEFHIQIYEEQRNKFVRYMASKGIELLVRDEIPNHKLQGLGLEKWNLPITEKLAKTTIRLPLYPELTDEEVDYIIKCIKSFYGK